MALLNRNNLLMWSATPPEADHLHNLTTTSGQMGVATVLLVPGEESTFYLPGSVSLASTAIHLVKADTLASVGQIGSFGSTITEPAGVAITVTGPSGLKEEYYRLRIQLSGGYIYSQRVWYKPSGYDSLSVQVVYSNPDPILGIPYGDNFELSARIKVTSGAVDAESSVETYDELSTGIPRTVNVKQKGFTSFSFSADAIGVEGIRSILNHENISINGQNTSVKSGLQIESTARGVSLGKFEVWLHGTAILNRC